LTAAPLSVVGSGIPRKPTTAAGHLHAGTPTYAFSKAIINYFRDSYFDYFVFLNNYRARIKEFLPDEVRMINSRAT